MDNGKQPAFPVNGIETDWEQSEVTGEHFARTYSYEKDAGLTKRELFAAMAMQGLLRCDDTEIPEDQLARFAKTMGRYAIAYADALLEQLREDCSGGK